MPEFFLLQDLSKTSRALARGEEPVEPVDVLPALPDLSTFLGESLECATAASPRESRQDTMLAQKSKDGTICRSSENSSDVILDIMLDKKETSFHVAAEAPRMSLVKQRCAELELLRPFCEARDLMRASLVDPHDRDRSRLAFLVGENGGDRVARAHDASRKIVKSEVKLQTSVLLEFLAACDSCEQVLTDRVTGDWRRAKWLEAMKSAAETYLDRMRVLQKTQEELEQVWLSGSAVQHGPEEQVKQDEIDASPDPLDTTKLEVEHLGLLSEFLGEYPPSMSETFSFCHEDRQSMAGRLLLCVRG